MERRHSMPLIPARAGGLVRAALLALVAVLGTPASAEDPSFTQLDERYHRDPAASERDTTLALAAAIAAHDPRAEMIATRNRLMAIYYGGDADLARIEALARRGLALAEQLKDDEAAATFRLLMAEMLGTTRLGLEQGVTLLDSVASYARAHGDDRLLADATYWHGGLDFLRGLDADALRELHEAAVIYERLHLRRMTALMFVTAAEDLRAPAGATPGDLAQAKDLLLNALPLLDPSADRGDLINALIPLGVVEARQGDLAAAQATLERAVSLASNYTGAPQLAMRAHVQYARLLLQRQQPDEALVQATMALGLLDAEANVEYPIGVRLMLARAHAQRQERREALGELATARALVPKPATPRLEALYQGEASEVYAALGDLARANEALRAQRAAERDVARSTSDKQLKEMQVRFQVDLKDRENALLKARAAEDASRRLAMGLGLALSLLLAGAGAVVYQLRLRTAREHNATLARLAEIGRELTRGLDLNAVVNALGRQLHLLADVTLAAVWLTASDAEDPVPGRVPEAEGLPARLVRGWPALAAGESAGAPPPDDVAATARTRAEIVTMAPVAPARGWRRLLALRPGRHAGRIVELTLPLLSGDVLIGVATIGVANMHLTARQREIVRATGLYAAVALHNIRTARRLGESLVELEQQRTRDVLVHTAQLVTVGSMAGGIVHEMAHPVGSMMLQSDNARDSLQVGDASDARDALEDIQREARRLQQLITRLRNLCRADTPRIEEVTLQALLDDARVLYQPQLRFAGICSVQTPGQADAARVRVDLERVALVVANIVFNARDAMEGSASPRIEISTTLRPGYACIDIRDTGPGLAQEQLARLFEPFFTTKPPGKGLGLGLALSMKSIASIRGRIQAANHPEGGAVFTIWLPLAETALSEGVGVDAPAQTTA